MIAVKVTISAISSSRSYRFLIGLFRWQIVVIDIRVTDFVGLTFVMDQPIKTYRFRVQAHPFTISNRQDLFNR